jgi:hypothetical protein
MVMGRLRSQAAVVVAVAVAVAGAGCSGGGSIGSSRRAAPDAGPATGTASTSGQADDRTRLATAFARRIAARVPRLPGQEPLAVAPAGLVHPDEVLGASDLVTQSRYWTVPGTPLQVYQALKRSPSARYRLTGYGAPGRGSDLPGRAFLSYDGVPAPRFVQGAGVHVEISRYGSRRSAVASFGEVEPHPVRSDLETIAIPAATGSYRWPRVIHGKVVAHVSATLSPRQVHTLITRVDRAPVADSPDACLGGFRLSGDVLTVYLRGGRHEWRLLYPGTSCDDLAVFRDGHPLPALAPTKPLRHQLGVLEHGDGIVTGRLLEGGGPPGAEPTPERGTVRVEAIGRTVATAHSGADGHFAVDAQPGRYTLSATARHYRIDGVRAPCAAEEPVTVSTGVTTHVDVYCQRR